ncbi:MAG: hypothetical protein P4L59_18375 [Desulfosporosinus sp.]|nr:hypothetical protein [Desulfosporosinus sp.]
MMRKTKIKTIVITTAITLLSVTAVFADTTSRNTVQAPKFPQTRSCEASGWLKSRLDSLVKDGAITLDQEDAIKIAITIANEDAVANGDFNGVDNGGSKYVLDGLVTDGTITHTQETAIQSANLN